MKDIDTKRMICLMVNTYGCTSSLGGKQSTLLEQGFLSILQFKSLVRFSKDNEGCYLELSAHDNQMWELSVIVN